jgi:hypothetical protein
VQLGQFAPLPGVYTLENTYPPGGRRKKMLANVIWAKNMKRGKIKKGENKKKKKREEEEKNGKLGLREQNK